MKRKKTNPRKKVITQADFNRATDLAIKELSMSVVLFSAMALHDVYGFGPERIARFTSNLLKKFNDWDDGAFNVEDAKEWFEDYTGMKLDMVTEGNDDSKRAVMQS